MKNLKSIGFANPLYANEITNISQPVVRAMLHNLVTSGTTPKETTIGTFIINIFRAQ